MLSHVTPAGWFCLVAAAASAAIVIWYLVREPPLFLRTKLTLLFGVGALPAAVAVSSTTIGMQETTERRFCGSLLRDGETHLEFEQPESRGRCRGTRQTRFPVIATGTSARRLP